MEEYIYSIIKKFNDRDEIITRDALMDIFDHYVLDQRLEKYVYFMLFVEDDSISASYSHNRIKYNYSKHISEEEDNPIYCINFSVVETLLHELKHAEHKKLLYSLKNDNFKKLVNKNPFNYAYNLLIEDSCYYFYMNLNEAESSSLRMFKDDEDDDLDLKFNSIYNEYHDIFPDERICEIDSFKRLKNMVSKFEKDEGKFKEYLDYLDSYYYFYLIKEYELEEDGILISPVERFIRKFSFEDHRDTLIDLRKNMVNLRPYDKLSIMRLGLRIDYETYKTFVDYCYKSNLFNDSNNEEENAKIRQYK